MERNSLEVATCRNNGKCWNFSGQQFSNETNDGKMRKIGYAHVSSVNQKLDRQLGALRAEECNWIYE